ncbi:PAS domain-containing sensor histidine kinase [Halorubrum salinarum]|uniref:histidine kinase n=1 Tax=Halorubrum salinarum TaxID=2739057 RepID=A0A7D4D2P6_9EURY|nr:PAS domain-containing sensor histidine kinase [Halorubrum salinarum]QKG91622.1 PAS domain-containing sensor histidine kinase [Halorubrum salinarum]
MGGDPGDADVHRETGAAGDRYRMLFENNPIVIWEHDFSAAKSYLNSLRVDPTEVAAFLDSHPSEVAALFDEVETVDVNRNAVEYYGARSKEHLLDNVDQVLDEEAWDLTVELWAGIAAGKTRFRGETVANTFDGKRRHQILQLYVPEAYAETYERVYMTGTDITDLKERERELQRERDKLDEFASIVSHDLRNPLGVAQGRIALARADGDLSHLAPAARSIDRSLELIDDLLSLARAGSEIGDLDDIPLAAVVRDCEAQVDGAAVSLVGDLPTIRADRSRVGTLLENLLRNAVEHGGGDVAIAVGGLDGGFYLEDDGAGIPADDRDAVFDVGFSSNADGTGFGLSIVAQIADAHGWDVRVTDGADGGARFEVTGVESAS